MARLSTLKGWPLVFTFVDLAWGMVRSSVVTAIAVSIARRFV